jgi:hypothetical protein
MVGVLVMSACSGSSTPDDGIVLLTRGGCVDTETMRANLKIAVRELTPPAALTVVDLDTLPTDDIRRGYPTPTLLFANRDVFGLAVPKPPLPQRT